MSLYLSRLGSHSSKLNRCLFDYLRRYLAIGDISDICFENDTLSSGSKISMTLGLFQNNFVSCNTLRNNLVMFVSELQCIISMDRMV
jgi:hypothetical protein